MDEIDYIIGADEYVNENGFIEIAIDHCDKNYPCPYLDKAR